jgi:hypothetical protein
MNGQEPWSRAAGIDWLASQLDRLRGLAVASALDGGLADDLISARDLALVIEDWAKHRAGSGDYSCMVDVQMRSGDQDSSHTFTVPLIPDTADFLGKLARQITLLAGRRVDEHEIIHTLTELKAIANGLTQAVVKSLSKSAGEG